VTVRISMSILHTSPGSLAMMYHSISSRLCVLTRILHPCLCYVSRTMPPSPCKAAQMTWASGVATSSCCATRPAKAVACDIWEKRLPVASFRSSQSSPQAAQMALCAWILRLTKPAVRHIALSALLLPAPNLIGNSLTALNLASPFLHTTTRSSLPASVRTGRPKS
jgi:hypothetical protein